MLVKIKFKKLHKGAIIPKFATKGSACFDLCACYLGVEYGLGVGANVVVPTGLACEVPEGYEMQIRPRSGLAAKHGIAIINSPGSIDSDYRGEIRIILRNEGYNSFTIHHGDRIAQGAIRAVPNVEILEVDELSVTKRDKGGFGSTGV